MTWILTKDQLPELGKKVLCQYLGDIYVAMLFEDMFIPIPFGDSKFAVDTIFPEMWAEIDFPKSTKDGSQLNGKLMFQDFDNPDGKRMDMRQLKDKYPKLYWHVIEIYKNSIGQCCHEMEKN